MKETARERALRKKQELIFEKIHSAYDTEGMQEEDGVVTMQEALAINKTLTQNRSKLIKNHSK